MATLSFMCYLGGAKQLGEHIFPQLFSPKGPQYGNFKFHVFLGGAGGFHCYGGWVGGLLADVGSNVVPRAVLIVATTP